MSNYQISTVFVAIYLFLCPALCFAAGGQSNTHHYLFPAVIIVLLGARIGGNFARRHGQPMVLGELLVGVLLGSLSIVGITQLDFIKSDPVFHSLAELGVLILLFKVGLENSVADLWKVGATALGVAVLGIVAPFVLGWAVAWIFLPESSWVVHMFVGATLTATSVGITSKVLEELNHHTSQEGKIILAAAVVDDILGLIVLALATGAAQAQSSGASLDLYAVSKVFGLSIGFVFVSLYYGGRFSEFWFAILHRVAGRGMVLIGSLTFCLLFASVAGLFGLAPIVGAFAAGLVLEPKHLTPVVRQEFISEPTEHQLHRFLRPLSLVLTSIFFVLTGARVDIAAFFSSTNVLFFALCLSVVAIIGKQMCALAIRHPKVDRVTIGLGMIPRGEVGLIFVGIGATLILNNKPLINPEIFAAVVLMVLITTLITPPLLSRRLKGKGVIMPAM